MGIELNDTKLEFKTRRECVDYAMDTYGICCTTIRGIINSKMPYNPRTKALYHLKGLRIYHL